MAERFYCAGAAEGGMLRLEGDEARHLARVRRIGPGETVELFDGQGFATRAEVVSTGRDTVTLRAVGGPLPDRAPILELTLMTAVPKGDRFDWLVEKATEIGVARLVPVMAERSVVDPRAGKLERLRRTVIEACKQCGRNRLMGLEPVASWAEVAARPGDHLRLLAHPTHGRLPDWPRPPASGRAWVAVGPEGGFTDAEVETARDRGWQTVGLGPTLLRIETAGLVACAQLLAREEWAG